MPNLGIVAEIRTNFPSADFWLVRRGSLDRLGEPTKEFNPEHIGFKVRDEYLDRILPQFMFYWFMNMHQTGAWKQFATGALPLQHIRIEQVRSLPVHFQE